MYSKISFPGCVRQKYFANKYPIIKNIMNNLIQKLQNSCLYCFTPDILAQGRDIINLVQQQINGGCDIIQLREKNLPDREKMQLALRIRKITNEKNILFIVNDDVDIAYFSDADGIHLGQEDLPVKYARQLLKNKIIGISTSTLEEYKEAQDKDVNYVAIGPVFSTATKEDSGSGLGISELSKALKYKKKLTAVIGGINFDNLNRFSGLEIDMFAIISDIINTKTIINRVKQIKEKIREIKKSN